MKKLSWLVTVLLLPVICLAETIPLIHGTTLSGEEVVLPRDLRTQHSILILGFSERSGESSRGWSKKIWAELISERHDLSCYQVPVLAAAPRLLRGVIVRAIKKDTLEEQRHYFVPIFEKEQEWKRTVQFSEPDTAYLLLVKQSGEVEWKTHGEFTPERMQEMKTLLHR